MYKDLMKVMFSDDGVITKEQVMPLERQINTLIMNINDSADEMQSKGSEEKSRPQSNREGGKQM